MLTMNGCDENREPEKSTATEFVGGLSHAADDIIAGLKDYFRRPDRSQAVVDLPDIRITPEEKLELIFGNWKPRTTP
jgi:hypothetical protein